MWAARRQLSSVSLRLTEGKGTETSDPKILGGLNSQLALAPVLSKKPASSLAQMSFRTSFSFLSLQAE